MLRRDASRLPASPARLTRAGGALGITYYWNLSKFP